MYLVLANRKFPKDKFAAAVSFIFGLIFFLGLFLHAAQVPKFSVNYVIEQLGKITVQSNLLALLTSGIYLFKPNHKYFTTNFLPLFSISLLWFAGLGFWSLLFPLYYIDLGNLLISADEPKGHLVAFYAIWDHTITQLAFLIFFYYLNKKKDLTMLNPVPTKKMIKWAVLYSTGFVLWNVFASFFLNIFPTYGILTNFNPDATVIGENSEIPFFNVRFLIISNLACLALECFIFALFSLLAIKWRVLCKIEFMQQFVERVSKGQSDLTDF